MVLEKPRMNKKQKVDQAFAAGLAHHQAGRIEQSIPFYREVLALDPRHSDANHLLGLALHQSGDDEQAIPLFRRSIMLEPRNPACFANFAELWRKQKKWDEAVENYRMALAIRPDDFPLRQLLAEALAKLERHQEALPEFQKIIQDGHGTGETWWGMSEVLRQLDRLEEAVAASVKATELDPNVDGSWHSLGWNLVRIGKVRESIPHFNRALQLAPNKPVLFWRRAWARLLLGEYDTAWADYESRWNDEDLQLKDRRPIPGLIWRGDEISGDITGKSLFIHLEQGLGDTIQFIRYVPMIFEKGAARVILECHQSLEAIVRRSFPSAELITEPGRVPPYDFHAPLLSLPYAFHTLVETVPSKVPYLQPDAAMVEKWRQRLAALPGRKVGLVWSGNPAHKNDRHRSMRLGQFAPLANVQGIQFINLQKGPGASQMADNPGLNLLDWTSELNTWDDTAALVAALDLVIAVDTSVCHLSGAIARPTWTLLPFAPDFRWMIERDDTPWYPTMRLFRQPKLRDWDSVIQTLRDQLSQFAQTGAA